MAKTSRSRRQTLRLSRFWILALVFVLLFGSIGTYQLIKSYASSASGLRGNAAMYGWTPSAQPMAGDTITMHWHLSIGSFGDLDPELPFTTKWTVTPSANTTNVSPTSGQFVTDSNFAHNNSNHKDIYITATATGDCGISVNIQMAIFGKSGAQVGSGSAGSGPSGGGTNCYGSEEPTPTPDPNPDPNPDPSPGPDEGPKGTGDGPKGEGTGPSGTGTGGGSSGSTATKNGNDPNSTPSSSNQGNKDQTKLDPSPFYDGKQYQRGSESDSGLGGLFNKPASGGIAKGWYLLTAMLLLSGGVCLWWRRVKRKL